MLAMDLSTTYQVTGIAASVVLVLVAVVAWARWVKPRLDKLGREYAGVRDSILGRQEITDSITGKVISPALDGMGVRQARTEEQTSQLISAVAELVSQNQRIDDHEHRLKRLEEGAVERIVGRAESTEAYRAMQAAFHADPSDGADQSPELGGVGEEPDTEL